MTVTGITAPSTYCAGSSARVELLDAYRTDDGERVIGTVRCPQCGRQTPLNTYEFAGHVPQHHDVGARDADILRHVAAMGQAGWARTPANFYLGADTEGPGAAYWAREHAASRLVGLDDERVLRLMRLLNRYKRYHRLATQVWPRWVEWNRTHWADNSVESNQVATDGSERVRTVMITAPHGDTC